MKLNIRRTVVLFVVFSVIFFENIVALNAWGEEGAENEYVLTLQQAFDMALHQNDQIKAYEALSKEAEAGRKSALLDMFLKGSLSYSYTGLDEYQYARAFGMKLQMSGTEIYHWDVTLIQPLFTGFALFSQYQIAALNEEIKGFENEQKQLDIIRDVNDIYFGVLLSEKAFQVASETVDALSAHEEDATKYYEQGLIPHNDLLKSKVALKNAQQEKEKAFSHVRRAKSGLNITLGRDMFTPLQLVDVETMVANDIELASAISRAIEQRPKLKAIGLGIQSMEKAVTLARSRYYPTISLAGVYQQEGDDWQASENAYANQKNTIVKVQAEWDFPELGKIRTDVVKAKHRLDAVKSQCKLAEDGVRVEVENAWLNLNVAEKNIKTAREALEQARENWRITDLQYQEQVSTSTDVLDARAYLSQADMNYYQALYGYMTAMGELNWAVGKRYTE